ncbi:hypothetical protein I5398_01105 [Citrobacter freundii]|nr:hypothetical protein [Citrobacter freundii]HED2431461.1 hypothetical protein [Citrobacter freundii]
MELDESDDTGAYFLRNRSQSAESRYLEKVFDNNSWDELLAMQTIGDSITPELKSAFHLFWIVSGHFIRERIGNDEKLLDLLRAFLPPYDGDGMFLFRGENIDRFNDSRIGFCWTQTQKKAEQFARGLNACGKGGILLKAWVPAASILAGIHPHSVNLGENEITVDSTGIEQIEIIRQYPPSH